MLEPNQVKYIGVLLVAMAIVLVIAHLRPYSLYSASKRQIRQWSVIDTLLSFCGFVLFLGADLIESNAPREILLIFLAVAIIFSPIGIQLQFDSYKRQIEEFKRYDRIIKSQSLHRQPKWWLIFHRDLPSFLFRQDRKFWIHGYEEK